MRSYIPALLSCCFLFLQQLPANARVLGELDLSALCDRADVVVVARGGEARQVGATAMTGTSYPAKRVSMPLAVDKILKGQPISNILVLSFSLTTGSQVDEHRAPTITGQYAVFFLRDVADGYEVLDSDYPTVIAFPGSPQILGTTLDQVTAEVSYVLQSPQATAEDKERALWALAGTSNPIATAALTKATHEEPSPDIRLAALALLLRRNDISELSMAEDILLHPPAAANQGALDGVAAAIRFGVRDPKAIPVLARLVLANNANTRKGAAMALRRTHDSAAIKPLTLALSDTDPDVLYQSVIGLAELTHTHGESFNYPQLWPRRTLARCR